jgi:hypothetical protein
MTTKPSKRRRRSGPALLAVATTAALMAAGCGSGDDVGENETPTPPPTFKPSNLEAPAWAVDPLQVAALKTPSVADGWREKDGCVYRSDVYARANAADPERGYEIVRTDKDPIEVVMGLDGVFASPVYQASPMPARMFFPGSAPVPAKEDPREQVPDNSNEPRITVIDTEYVVDAAQGIERPWTYGHANFVGSVIDAHSSTDPNIGYFDVSGQDNALDLVGDQTQDSDYWDEVQLDNALREAAGAATNEDHVVNLSLGVYPCTVDSKTLVPVVATQATLTLANSLAAKVGTEAEFAVVAAAGNSHDGRLTFPAAFADTAKMNAELGTVEDPIKVYFDRAAELVEPSMIAVGAIGADAEPEWAQILDPEPQPANTAQVDPIPYSSTGAWITTNTQGCHVGAHPGGEVMYPEHPNGAKAVSGPLGERVYWCGTSFAAPVVTALVAQQMSLGQDLGDIKQRLLVQKNKNQNLNSEEWPAWSQPVKP